jgi:hypothetical protein
VVNAIVQASPSDRIAQATPSDALAQANPGDGRGGVPGRPLVGVIRREASPTTDYGIELAHLDRDIAELRDDASGAPRDVDRATSVAHRLFRRVVLTGGAEDFRTRCRRASTWRRSASDTAPPSGSRNS